MHNGWGMFVMVKNVWIAHEGSFLTVNMYQCKNIMGGHLSMLHQAAIEKLQGELPVNIIQYNLDMEPVVPQVLPPVVGEGLSDDDFFHVTCHVDSALKTKINKEASIWLHAELFLFSLRDE